MIHKKFLITGMMCSGCQHNIEKTIKKIKGVKNVNVNLVSNTMTLDCAADFPVETIINTVASIGYGAQECSESVSK